MAVTLAKVGVGVMGTGVGVVCGVACGTELVGVGCTYGIGVGADVGTGVGVDADVGTGVGVGADVGTGVGVHKNWGKHIKPAAWVIPTFETALKKKSV